MEAGDDTHQRRPQSEAVEAAEAVQAAQTVHAEACEDHAASHQAARGAQPPKTRRRNNFAVILRRVMQVFSFLLHFMSRRRATALAGAGAVPNKVS